MSLSKPYPPDFERIWSVYPKWPKGRSKKDPSFKAFDRAKRELDFTEEDIDQLVSIIEENKRSNVQWQHGSQYGPPMFATWFNQRRWQDEFVTVGEVKKAKRDKYDRAGESLPQELTPEERERSRAAMQRAMEDLRRVH